MSFDDVALLKDQEEYQIIGKELLSIMQPLIRCYSPSGSEDLVAKAILDFVKDRCHEWRAFSDCDITNGIGNILAVPKAYLDESSPFASKKKLPVLMAHMDTVDRNNREQLSTYTFPDSLGDHGIVGGEQNFVLGFDDKAGIALILHLMSTCQNPDFKVLFTVQEEQITDPDDDLSVSGRNGGGGIQYALNKYPEFFDTSLWTIMMDRAEDKSGNVQNSVHITIRGKGEPSDVVCWYLDRDTCSPAFKAKIEEISVDLGTPMISQRSGAKADIYNIRLSHPAYSSVNLACGGYREHKSRDYLCLYQTIRTLRVVRECIRQQDGCIGQRSAISSIIIACSMRCD
ncbi:MAG: hypothetical protein GXX82_15095 [Syntrophorhabdus sp.]|nr:hypothetical protein [Syntrophorhabdus sp.]